MSSSFVHLHLHTEYSLLDGAVRISDLMKKVTSLGMPAVAITDHGNLYGAIEFYQAAKSKKINPILGCEVYLAPGNMQDRKEIPGRKRASHLTLLAETTEGFQNLTRLVSRAHLDGFYHRPRVDKATLAELKKGLICLSGCINGEINEFILSDRLDEARKSLEEFLEIFGKDHFYLEIMDHGYENQTKSTLQMIQFAKEYDLKLVATNDVHFLNKEDHEAHDVMICIGTNSGVMDEKRMRYSNEVYLKTPEEMRELFKDLPEACDNTLEIAERCSVEIKIDSASIEKYPVFDSPDGSPLDVYFTRLCEEGLVKRYGKQRAEEDTALKERLTYEISIMHKMGFLSYFLIVADFIGWAKQRGIPVGPGRGSAAGSLVAYVLEITDLCPIQFGLIFERFLNPERVSPPDVDVDFCQEKRGQVIDYVREKYGERAVSHIITFGTLGAKSVIRDVARVLGWSYGEADRLAKMIPTELNITLNGYVDKSGQKQLGAKDKNPELAAELASNAAAQQLWEYASFLEGLTRGVGIHAAGIVIGDRPLDEHVPLTRGNEGEVVTQYAMGPLTDLGMLKMDFLGLKTLTVIEHAVQHIYKEHPNFKIDQVPLDDLTTFKLLQSGETTAVFQLESGGMSQTCRQMGVDRIEDIIALLSLYRPGPMSLIPDYIARKKGEQEVEYLHPLLEDASRETYGIIIYQEQVQKAANLLAGYSLGEADLLRRAMGKKKPEEMAKQRTMFVEGCQRVNQIPKQKADDIFDLLEKFAGYGFNKSHAAAYGLITYRTAYLKANFPVEFMAGVLSNEINNTDKISIFVEECRRMGIPILPPDINESDLRFKPQMTKDGKKGIRYGLAAIKNVGEGAMQLALEERNGEKGAFKSLEDFARRVDSKAVNKKILESLIRAGAFDFTGEARDVLFDRIDTVLGAASVAQRDRRAGQFSLFGEEVLALTTSNAGEESGSQLQRRWTQEEILAAEKELLGFYVSGHPLDGYRAQLSHPKNVRLGEVHEVGENKRRIYCGGMIRQLEVKYTKKDNRAFGVFVLEDFTGSLESIAWSDAWMKFGSSLKNGMVVLAKARPQKDDRSESWRLTIDEVKIIEPDTEEQIKKASRQEELAKKKRAADRSPYYLNLPEAKTNSAFLRNLREVVLEHPGSRELCLVFHKNGRQLTLTANEKFRVDPSDAFKQALSQLLG